MSAFVRVLFPGALNSEFTDSMEFIMPATHKAIPTYRVMNQEGRILDKEGVDTADEEALSLYKNMVSCEFWNLDMSTGGILTVGSEYHGCAHVRGPKTGQTEFLHGETVFSKER